MNFLTKYPARSGLLLLSVFILLSVFFIFEHAEKEKSRDLMNWQVRLSILADMRTASVESFLEEKKNKLKTLANNPTLKLYLSQYNQLDSNDVALQAQLAHVRNLLQATSTRFGFSNKKQTSINTEQDEKRLQGVAVLSNKGEMLFSTRGFYKDLSRHQQQIQAVLKTGQAEMLDMFKVDSKRALFGYILPVYPIQKIQGQQAIGAVLLLLNPESGLYKQLENIYLNTRTDESILVRKSGLSIDYLSPLSTGVKLLYKRPLKNMKQIFSSQLEMDIRNDYSNKKVLSVQRKIDATEWVLIQKVDADEALQESDSHQQYLFSTFFLISFLLVSLFVAVWRHSTSVRLLKISNELESHTTLLNAVSEHMSESVFLIDEQNKFIFSNSSLAEILNLDVQDISGKSMASVFGHEMAEILNSLDCESNHSRIECVVALMLGEKENIYHVSSMTLKKGAYKNAKLFVLHDVTIIKAAEEKKNQLSRSILSTLVKAVDLHDPYCVNHSERTKEVALDIAQALGLESNRCEALEMAALLANIGKLYVRKEILTKMEALTEEESQALRRNVVHAAEILDELSFEGPVVEIITQKNEKLDGSGYPAGLKQEDIMLEARILAVSNAFVAMVSSRAYRQGMPIKEAVDLLIQQADTFYDRHVVAALFHIAENRRDWASWQKVTE